MVRWNKVGSVAGTGLAVVVWLAPGFGRAQAPGQGLGPVLGEGAAQIDAPIPGRAITPGQDSFLYPSPVVPGLGGTMVPRPLGRLPMPVPLRPLRPTRPRGPVPAGTASPGTAGGTPSPGESRPLAAVTRGAARSTAGGSTSSGEAGSVSLPWVNRPERGYSSAMVLSPHGAARHYWIWWPSLHEYYYLFDPARTRYLGAYDRVARAYRPLDAGARRWGKATAPPLPVPSGSPAALESRGTSDQPPGVAPRSARPRGGETRKSGQVDARAGR
jgi:hypothetical protein